MDVAVGLHDELGAVPRADADQRLAAERLDLAHAPLDRPEEPLLAVPQPRVLGPRADDHPGGQYR